MPKMCDLSCKEHNGNYVTEAKIVQIRYLSIELGGPTRT